MSDESSSSIDSDERSGDEASDNDSFDEEEKDEKTDRKIPKVQRGKKLQAKWDDMFERLLIYKNEHGDCLVPNRYAKDPQLGSWVSTQRRHYKILMSDSGDTTPMTPARARKLEEIGFKWSTKDPRHVPWEYRYNQLVAFKEKYGHTQVPIGWQENIKLSNWVSTQRQEYKLIQSGRQSRLSESKISLLDDVDFIWEAQRGGPRRKRKATVAVPSKPNPVDARKIKTRTATRGGKAGASTRGGSLSARDSSRSKVNAGSDSGEFHNRLESNAPNQLPISQQQSLAINNSSMIGMNAGTAALLQGTYIPTMTQTGLSGMGVPGLQLATNPWQLLAANNGAFQSSIPPSMGLVGGNSSFFPLSTRLGLAQPGLQQLSSPQIDPSRQLLMQQAALGQLSSFQHQTQASSLLNNPGSTFNGSVGIQHLQPFQLQQLYLQGNAAQQEAEIPKRDVRKFSAD